MRGPLLPPPPENIPVVDEDFEEDIRRLPEVWPSWRDLPGTDS